MKPLLPFLVLTSFVMSGCASHTTRVAPAPSTAGVRQSISAIAGNVSAAQQANAKAAGSVASARQHAGNVGRGLDTIRGDAKEALKLLNRP